MSVYEPGCPSVPKLAFSAAAAVAVHSRVLPSMWSTDADWCQESTSSTVRQESSLVGQVPPAPYGVRGPHGSAIRSWVTP